MVGLSNDVAEVMVLRAAVSARDIAPGFVIRNRAVKEVQTDAVRSILAPLLGVEVIERAPIVPCKVQTRISRTAIFFTRPGRTAERIAAIPVAAIWPSLEVIRDPYSKASQGVILTWITLWDAECAFRSSAYKRISFKLA